MLGENAIIMGVKDLHRIAPLFAFLQKNYPDYNWKMDTGNKETAIQILDDNSGTVYHPPGFRGKTHSEFLVPDIYSSKAKVAIEFQEQPKKKKHRGRYSKKGHTEFSDEFKDLYYKHGGIRQVKIWDDDHYWWITLQEELKKLGLVSSKNVVVPF